MSKSYPATVTEENVSAVSWGAIFVGALAAGALTLISAALATATGFALVSPWSNEGISPTAFKVTSGIFLVVTAMISSTVGGYIAGRLRTKWVASQQEVLFRDTAHGLAAWAFATLVVASVLGYGAASLVGAGAHGLFQGAAQSASSTSANDYFVDTLLRPATTTAAPTTTAQSQYDATATRREVSSIFARDLTSGAEFPAADRAYLSQIVQSRSGLTKEEADKKVGDVITQAKASLDTARKYTIAVALWVTLALLAGAFAASAAAIEGGQLRDGRWRGVLFAPRNEVTTR